MDGEGPVPLDSHDVGWVPSWKDFIRDPNILGSVFVRNSDIPMGYFFWSELGPLRNDSSPETDFLFICERRKGSFPCRNDNVRVDIFYLLHEEGSTARDLEDGGKSIPGRSTLDTVGCENVNVLI
jgi:hypothetical protein